MEVVLNKSEVSGNLRNALNKAFLALRDDMIRTGTLEANIVLEDKTEEKAAPFRKITISMKFEDPSPKLMEAVR